MLRGFILGWLFVLIVQVAVGVYDKVMPRTYYLPALRACIELGMVPDISRRDNELRCLPDK